MTITSTQKNYYPALDGLRGIAILLVLLHHNFDFIPFLSFGWIGVDLFFVLSGFLITDILLQTKDQKHYLRNFYIRRVLRIFPLYYLCIILYLLIIPHLPALSGQYRYYNEHQLFLWTNTQNWLYVLHKIPDDHLLLLHFWSLSVEEQFYLFWPLLMLLVKNPRYLVILLLFLLLVGIMSRIIAWNTGGNEYWCFQFQGKTRMDGLYLGCMIALWKYYSPRTAKKRLINFCILLLSIHSVAAICIKIFWPNIPHFSFLGYTSIAAVFALIVWYGITGKGKLKEYLLENKYLKWLGKISYGLYVYHWLLLVLFRHYLTSSLKSSGFSGNNSYILISVTAAIAAIALSGISYHLFEKKILAQKNRFY